MKCEDAAWEFTKCVLRTASDPAVFSSLPPETQSHILDCPHCLRMLEKAGVPVEGPIRSDAPEETMKKDVDLRE